MMEHIICTAYFVKYLTRISFKLVTLLFSAHLMNQTEQANLVVRRNPSIIAVWLVMYIRIPSIHR